MASSLLILKKLVSRRARSSYHSLFSSFSSLSYEFSELPLDHILEAKVEAYHDTKIAWEPFSLVVEAFWRSWNRLRDRITFLSELKSLTWYICSIKWFFSSRDVFLFQLREPEINRSSNEKEKVVATLISIVSRSPSLELYAWPPIQYHDWWWVS